MDEQMLDDIEQHCADTGCTLEALPGVMDDRKGWLESR